MGRIGIPVLALFTAQYLHFFYWFRIEHTQTVVSICPSCRYLQIVGPCMKFHLSKYLDIFMNLLIFDFFHDNMRGNMTVYNAEG